MASFEELKIRGFDHIEFAVADLERSVETCLRLGFSRLGYREIRERQLRSVLMGQNSLYILLSHAQELKDPVAQYVQRHGDGVITLALLCEDATAAVDVAARRGATVSFPPKTIEKDFGSTTQASISAFGDICHTLVSRNGSLFLEGFDSPFAQGAQGSGLLQIDHVGLSVEPQSQRLWIEYYETIFGLVKTLTGTPAVNVSHSSTSMQSPTGTVKILIQEPSGEDGSIQQFLDAHHGPGVQHVALSTASVLPPLDNLRLHGVEFVAVPPNF